MQDGHLYQEVAYLNHSLKTDRHSIHSIHHFRDALIVSIINCSTSVFAGFAIFSLLGHMAFITNRAVSEVADSGKYTQCSVSGFKNRKRDKGRALIVLYCISIKYTGSLPL